jgi:2,4-dienoyl-CoA reductase-like NADH-dependent reductase (Old Yellow Enzyme family)
MTKNDHGLVFTAAKISDVEIPNRLVRSATYECRATEEGFVTDDLVKVYEALARGGAGLTITGMSYVREDGCQLPKMIGNYSDDHIEGLSQIAGRFHDIVKENGNRSKIFLQTGHAGRQISFGGYNAETISSSSIEEKIHKRTPKALSIEEIAEIANCFGEASKRAKIAGFDGVQFHGAHGYLITQFYSPFMNKRTDAYGSTPENRIRFVIDLLKESRKRVGNQFPICLKMNGSDRINGGLDVSEASYFATILAEAGFDALEISSYIWEAGMQEKLISLPPESQRKIRERNLEAFNLDIAVKIKNAVSKKKNIPVILVGGLYRFETIRTILETTPIEFCALSRPLICQPDLPNLWRSSLEFPEAACIHCNLCTKDFLDHGVHCKGVRCIYQERMKAKQQKSSP